MQIYRCKTLFFTPIIPERGHYDAKLNADDKIWHFQTWIKFANL